MDANPYYTSYAEAHGKRPEEMDQLDKEAWPGGCMTGYILWIIDAKRRAFVEHPEWFMGSADKLCHFGGWQAFLEKLAAEKWCGPAVGMGGPQVPEDRGE